ncbi:MAG: TRAP transporter small permease [Deltaproteobacteria bacterium]|nr:TRAP transporter small permease [Deltaproteobacteria bacterium]
MKYLQKIDSYISRVENIVLIASLLFMIGVSFTQIILRKFFNTGFFWADEALRHFVLWVAFIGASLATRDERHIRMDVLARYVSQKNKQFLNFCAYLVSSCVCFVLVISTYHYILDEYQFKAMLSIGVPVWAFQLIIFFGFFMMGFRFFLKSCEAFQKFLRGY